MDSTELSLLCKGTNLPIAEALLELSVSSDSEELEEPPLSPGSSPGAFGKSVTRSDAISAFRSDNAVKSSTCVISLARGFLDAGVFAVIVASKRLLVLLTCP